MANVLSVICFLISISSMSHVNFKKCPSRDVYFKGQGPQKAVDLKEGFYSGFVGCQFLSWSLSKPPEAGLLRSDGQIMQSLSDFVTEK